MRVLLDTDAFFWWITDDVQFSTRAGEVISDGDNEVFLSAASGWEITIKAYLGRLKLPDHPANFIPQQLAYPDQRCTYPPVLRNRHLVGARRELG